MVVEGGDMVKKYCFISLNGSLSPLQSLRLWMLYGFK